MQLTCPHCGFSKEIPSKLLPTDPARVNCPRCKNSFPLEQPAAAAAQTVVTAQPTMAASNAADSLLEDAERRPKAGFWIRVTAWCIDKILVALLQAILGTLLLLAGFTSTPGVKENIGALVQLVWLFTVVVNIVYYVMFTGHCGQTPGKMAVRVKVIRRDGQQLSYGRAFFREVPGKFVSAVILGIGYLMVAFDEQKQGLHDRMANTYVIKL